MATRALANVSVSCEAGRRIKFALEQVEQLRQQAAGGRADQLDMFLPRRTTYVFEMQTGSADDAYSALPILVTRSKGVPARIVRRVLKRVYGCVAFSHSSSDDCPDVPPSICPSLPPPTAAAIAQVHTQHVTHPCSPPPPHPPRPTARTAGRPQHFLRGLHPACQ